jgi:hypothetical protein
VLSNQRRAHPSTAAPNPNTRVAKVQGGALELRSELVAAVEATGGHLDPAPNGEVRSSSGTRDSRGAVVQGLPQGSRASSHSNRQRAVLSSSPLGRAPAALPGVPKPNAGIHLSRGVRRRWCMCLWRTRSRRCGGDARPPRCTVRCAPAHSRCRVQPPMQNKRLNPITVLIAGGLRSFAASAGRVLRFLFGAFVLASAALVLAAIMATIVIILLAQNVRTAGARVPALTRMLGSLWWYRAGLCQCRFRVAKQFIVGYDVTCNMHSFVSLPS